MTFVTANCTNVPMLNCDIQAFPNQILSCTYHSCNSYPLNGSADTCLNAGPNVIGKRLSKATKATLESVFLRHNHPNDSVIDGIVTLHRIPRKQVIDWFVQRRKQSTDGPQQARQTSDRLNRQSAGRKGRY